MSWGVRGYYLRAWIKNLFAWRTFVPLLTGLGAVWVVVGPIAFLSEGFADWIKRMWWVWPSGGLGYAVWMRRPRLTVSCKLRGRDVVVEVAIGDMFDFSGALVVPTNTTFDTRISGELISAKSVQGQFTRAYYTDDSKLDKEVESALANQTGTQLAGKRIGKSKRYEMGTVIHVAPGDRNAYLVAIAHINEHGNAKCEFEDVMEALAKLWVFVGDHGVMEELVVPVLGTGAGRLTVKREDIVREIINSFVAACSERLFCRRLTVVISPSDAREYAIDLDRLGSLLLAKCEHADWPAVIPGRPVGQPTDATPTHFNDKRPDQREEEEFLGIKAQMPKFITAMKTDLSLEEYQNVREFFVLPNRRVSLGGSEKLRFVYYEDEYRNLRGKLDILENVGHVTDVTPGNVPIYRMTEGFVKLLRRCG